MSMKNDKSPSSNFKKTRQDVGYVSRQLATPATYAELGFKCGLEVHQQLKTREKLFCRCPAGRYHDFEDYDADILRHMRPTLSELGEYDGTALMEFKTKKNITYRINNETACTYEIDDTPPFPLNREALSHALEMSLLLKQNIVGEIHIIRKQYLDGSIPGGFQRTAIIGIEGEIPLKHKKVRIKQLSIEEDSCREVSDRGHERVYVTDRLGIPLIETVTYPELLTPAEAEEAGHYIRFLARSAGHVRTGIGAGRQDVNVSVTGGTRVEIKGVAHINRIPDLTHNEAFRQHALLLIKKILHKKVGKVQNWHPLFRELKVDILQNLKFNPCKVDRKAAADFKIFAVNLPGFKNILSFFTQPGRIFADEISDRLKVIACLEKPNMLHSEECFARSKRTKKIDDITLTKIKKLLASKEDDAQIIIWAPQNDLPTALETIEERCRMAFTGVPEETRKAMPDGTTVFERVLPGAGRMYPDTDSAPIPIEEEFISQIAGRLPKDLEIRIKQLKAWNIPPDTHHYLLRNNLMPVIEKIITDFDINPCFAATIFAHKLKHIQARNKKSTPFPFNLIYDLFVYLNKNNLEKELIFVMLPVLYNSPAMDFDSVLDMIGFKKLPGHSILAEIPTMRSEFRKLKPTRYSFKENDWIMSCLRPIAIGNIPLHILAAAVIKEKEMENSYLESI